VQQRRAIFGQELHARVLLDDVNCPCSGRRHVLFRVCPEYAYRDLDEGETPTWAALDPEPYWVALSPIQSSRPSDREGVHFGQTEKPKKIQWRGNFVEECSMPLFTFHQSR